MRQRTDLLHSSVTLRHGTLAFGASALGALLTVVVVDVVNADPAQELRPLAVQAGAPVGGDGTSERPFPSIQLGLNLARPGQTVFVNAGTYHESLQSVRSGRHDAPIRLIGDRASIVGDSGTKHLIDIRHGHLEIRGFDLSSASTVIAIKRGTGVRIVRNRIHGAQRECVRLRHLSVGNEIAFNRISGCGYEGFNLFANRRNGEGIYVGTAPAQLDRNPTDVPDKSNANWIHHNRITAPAECVDIKEDARANIVSHNRCTGSLDPDGAGFSSRGRGTVFRGNESIRNLGSGIRLGGDHNDDGIDSVVTGNHLRHNGQVGLKIIRVPQRRICGNQVTDNRHGPINHDAIDPTRRCPRA